MGPMTQQAIKNNKKKREAIPLSPRTSTKNQISNTNNNQASIIPSFISNLFSSNQNDYIPSDKYNLQAIMEHKIKTGVTEPYLYISPREGMLYRIQGNNILYRSPVATGVNFDSDGLTELPMVGSNKGLKYDRTITTSSTPAGVFTIGDRGMYANEPRFNLFEGREGNPNAKLIQAALHAPASADRQNKLMNGNNQLTFGCIQLPSGEMICLDKDINMGDSVYIEPTVNGNYLYEDKDGRIKTHFKNTPNQVSGTLWGKSFNANNVRYSTGY